MATGSDIVTGALRKNGIKSAETPIEPFEMNDGIEALNDMMAELEPTLNLGFVPIADAADEVRIPRFAVEAIKNNLGARLLNDYDKPMTALFQAIVVASTENLLRAIVNIDVNYPDTLPTGSGNECTDFNDDRFFPKNSKENF